MVALAAHVRVSAGSKGMEYDRAAATLVEERMGRVGMASEAQVPGATAEVARMVASLAAMAMVIAEAETDIEVAVADIEVEAPAAVGVQWAASGRL